ncbi:hypothetical protein GOODEAATRI_001767 [Goodea atripinnis]|uniref:Uncharacterized protein n=1 Tax=Goodea atripinnis TaxID=208336 RepID=A0ABV0NH32_9TELE
MSNPVGLMSPSLESCQFKSNMTTKMNPSLGRKFLQRIQECSKVSENLMELQSVAAGLPNCVVRNVKPQDILNNTETLKTISKQMRKGQLKVMLQGVSTMCCSKVFGPVPSMTESIIVQLGCITQSFSNSELEMLPLSLENLDEIAACGWKNSQVNCRYRSTRLRLVLSVVQLEALGPDNAAMVTSEQRAVLTEEQLSILKKATTGGQEDQKQTQALASGAPVSSLEGMSTFIKPVLFLFIGFLLL